MTLEEFRKLVAAATPGPWRYDYCGEPPGITHPKRTCDIVGAEGYSSIIGRESGMYGPGDADAEFIIACRDMVPKLLAVVDDLMALKNCDTYSGVEHADWWVEIDKKLAVLEQP